METFRRLDRFVLNSGIDAIIKKNERIVIGYSGGADSTLLLHYLLSRYGAEHITACHLNHMIRGEEADRDETFAMNECERLGVDFISRRVNIPELASQNGLGIEEAARDERYRFFEDVANGALIATAHNATDNLETLIFNLSRGTGTHGMGGIAPIRDNIIRPLLCLTGEEIRDACHELGISYVLDSTNTATDYTRNYIRHEIVSRLRHINEKADAAALRLSRIERENAEYISGEAQKLICGGCISRKAFISAHPALQAESLQMLFRAQGGKNLGEVHIELAREFAREKIGTLSMPCATRLTVERDRIYFAPDDRGEECEVIPEITLEISDKPIDFGSDFAVCLANSGSKITYNENIYNLFIQQGLSFATIYGNVSVRCRREGDRIFTHSLHKKLKKLMCDKGIPQKLRDILPLFCDERGIFFAPHTAIADNYDGNDLTLYVFIRKGSIFYE